MQKMTRRIDIGLQNFDASLIKGLPGSVKSSQRFCWDFCGGPIPETSGSANAHGSCSRDPRDSQTVLVGNGTVTYTDPDLCRTGLAQRMELARSQCGQIKTTSWRLAVFLIATEARKCSWRTTT
jgi:hypothetical protein